VTDHAWTMLLQRGDAPNTDTVEQCRCGMVRHVYAYATLERVMTTERWWKGGEAVPAGSACVEREG
jgi:hypothetical protein